MLDSHINFETWMRNMTDFLRNDNVGFTTCLLDINGSLILVPLTNETFTKMSYFLYKMCSDHDIKTNVGKNVQY